MTWGRTAQQRADFRHRKAGALVVEALNTQDAGQVQFLKLNADDNPQTMQTYGVRSLPTLIVFQAGQEVVRLVGYQPQPRVKARIDQALR